jgi:hypothetical protein
MDLKSIRNSVRIVKVKSKAIPVTSRGGPLGCETSRIAHFLDHQLTDGKEVVSFTNWPPFTPRKIPGSHLHHRLSQVQGHSVACRIKSIENPMTSLGIEPTTFCPVRTAVYRNLQLSHNIGVSTQLIQNMLNTFTTHPASH